MWTFAWNQFYTFIYTLNYVFKQPWANTWQSLPSQFHKQRTIEPAVMDVQAREGSLGEAGELLDRRKISSSPLGSAGAWRFLWETGEHSDRHNIQPVIRAVEAESRQDVCAPGKCENLSKNILHLVDCGLLQGLRSSLERGGPQLARTALSIAAQESCNDSPGQGLRRGQELPTGSATTGTGHIEGRLQSHGCQTFSRQYTGCKRVQ